jgi:epoxyqueuosine reductase
MGNRIYGCDDCQLICPWNRFAAITKEADFHARPHLLGQPLVTLFQWDEVSFLRYTEGTAIRRIGYRKWLRNISVALGNAPYNADVLSTLKMSTWREDALVGPHIAWAIVQHETKQRQATLSSRLTERLVRSVRKGLPRDA